MTFLLGWLITLWEKWEGLVIAVFLGNLFSDSGWKLDVLRCKYWDIYLLTSYIYFFQHLEAYPITVLFSDSPNPNFALPFFLKSLWIIILFFELADIISVNVDQTIIVSFTDVQNISLMPHIYWTLVVRFLTVKCAIWT